MSQSWYNSKTVLLPNARDRLVQPCCGTNERAACNISLFLVSVFVWSSLQSHAKHVKMLQFT